MWKALNKEKPGEEYLDPKEVERGYQNSVLMVVIADTNPERSYIFARWNYEFETFIPDDTSIDIACETVDYHTKLWMPLPGISSDLWQDARSFPRQASPDQSTF